MALTPTQKRAVEMYENGSSFRCILNRTNIRADEVLHLIGQKNAERREKKGACDTCPWRLNGTNSCVLPNCFLKSIGRAV